MTRGRERNWWRKWRVEEKNRRMGRFLQVFRISLFDLALFSLSLSISSLFLPLTLPAPLFLLSLFNFFFSNFLCGAILVSGLFLFLNLLLFHSFEFPLSLSLPYFCSFSPVSSFSFSFPSFIYSRLSFRSSWSTFNCVPRHETFFPWLKVYTLRVTLCSLSLSPSPFFKKRGSSLYFAPQFPWLPFIYLPGKRYEILLIRENDVSPSLPFQLWKNYYNHITCCSVTNFRRQNNQGEWKKNKERYTSSGYYLRQRNFEFINPPYSVSKNDERWYTRDLSVFHVSPSKLLSRKMGKYYRVR